MKRVLQSVFWLNLLIVVGFWIINSSELLFTVSANFFLTLGGLFGLLSACLVLTQLMLIGRISFIESSFGHDKLARIHHRVGRFVLIFILLHFAFIVYGYSLISGQGVISQIFDFITTDIYLRNAFVALVLFIMVVVCSLAIVRLKLKYETWYFVHLLVYLAILLGFGHQLQWGSDLARQMSVIYWWALYTVVITLFLIFRFGRILYYFIKHDFQVVKVISETADVNSIYISGKNIEKFPVKAGQFMVLRFLDKTRWWQAHPFSLSMVPKDNMLRITPKNSGDFTSIIHSVKPGTKIFVDGPLGIFTKAQATKNKVLLIAGGIGITPIRSLIEEFSRDNIDMVLLYSNKTAKDIVFKQELDKFISKNYYFLTEEQKSGFASGRIDTEKIKQFVPDTKEREVYVCGPEAFMDAIEESLLQLKVPKAQIHTEKFSLH